MPLFTDSLLLGEVVRRVAERLRRPRPVRAPAMAGKLAPPSRLPGHALGRAAGLSRPARRPRENFIAHGFRRIVLLNGHGGNIVPASRPSFEVRQRYRDARRLAPARRRPTGLLGAEPDEADAGIEQDRMGHACEWETSMMLRLDPRLVGDLTTGRARALRHAVRAGLAGLDHPATAASPATSATRAGPPPRKARSCSASSPTTCATCSSACSPGTGGVGTDDRPARRAVHGLALVGLRAAAPGDHAQLHGPPDPLAVGDRHQQGVGSHATRITAGSNKASAWRSRPAGSSSGSSPTGSACAGFTPRSSLAWSAAGFATGWAYDFDELDGVPGPARLLRGGAVALCSTASQRLLSRRDRALGNSILQSGAAIGAVITPLVVQALVSDAAGELARAVPGHRRCWASSGPSPGWR